MNGTGNHGSKVPLNLSLRKPLDEPIVKAEPLDAQHARNLRAGTPPIRTGMFNGAMPNMTPPVPIPQGPALVLKAVRDPALAQTGAIDKTPRKRGQDGKFADTQSAGPQSTASEDLANHERQAHLAAKRNYLKGLGFEDEEQGQGAQPAGPPAAGGGSGDAAPATGGAPNMPPNNGTPPPQPPAGAGGAAAAGGPPMPQPNGPQLAKPMEDAAQPGVPGAVPGQPNAPGAGGGAPGQSDAPGMNQADMMGMAPPIGQTPEGMPVYDDPYNPGHQSFTPDQHRYAAQLHNQQAEMMTTSGRIPSALDQQMKAQVHLDLANDAQSPMERMMNRQGGGQNPMDQFLTQMGQQDPGMNNGQMGGPRPDQNKPLSPDASAGPIPGMTNTFTGGKVGMQSQSAQHAGTMEQPQGMPPEPTGSSMPDVSGPVPGQMQTSPFDYNPDEFSDVDTSGEEAVPGGGAAGAPPSNAGAITQPGPDEGTMPTPGSTDSEPPTDNAGPSTNDNNPFAGQTDEDEMAAAGGNDNPPPGAEPTDEASEEKQVGSDKFDTKKAFSDWLFGN